MTVKQLIKLLSKQDPHRLVVIQKDIEGNDFSPIVHVWKGSYEPTTSWWGEAGLEKLTKSDIKAGFTQEDVIEGKPALFLVPIN